ncbi:MAG: hypothetical protein MUP85_05730 [Candidatus Lokiarchaeota archaeon]|nr:hypothetical protein [Candidatus Lokiarchaeota archaeon]
MNEKSINDEIKVVKDSCGCGCACSGAEESIDEEFSKLEVVENSNEKYNDSNKLFIDIYVPMDACACEWSQFMNLMFSAITPYIKHIKHETKSLNTDEARRMNLFTKCAIVDGKIKYTTSAALKRDLPRLLEEKGLM